MEPVTTALLSALVAGAVAGVGEAGKKLVVDGYGGLKAALRAKFGADSELAGAVEGLEKSSDLRQTGFNHGGLGLRPGLLGLARHGQQHEFVELLLEGLAFHVRLLRGDGFCFLFGDIGQFHEERLVLALEIEQVGLGEGTHVLLCQVDLAFLGHFAGLQ